MERLQPETHDNSFVEELISEGYTYPQALIIATTEMEGAAELEDGGIHARQTHCGELQYNETLVESQGMIDGRRATTRAVKQWLLENGFNSLQEYYASLEC